MQKTTSTKRSKVWVRSQYCDTGTCVETTYADGAFLIRDSKNPSGPELAFTPEEFKAFLAGVQAGNFNPNKLKKL